MEMPLMLLSSPWSLLSRTVCLCPQHLFLSDVQLRMMCVARLPKATFNEENGRTICSRKEKHPLQIGRTAISMSFGIFDSCVRLSTSIPFHSHTTHRSRLLADPTSFEEPLLDTTISAVIDDQSKLISVTQIGLGSTGAQDVLLDCITAAKKHQSSLKHIYDV
jgi:exosome complex component RRP43